jgi:hypothetical protein
MIRGAQGADSGRLTDNMNREGSKFMSVPFMKAPEPQFFFDVGDIVEVYCDHEKAGQRVRGWLKGIVVQVDAKMVAVQFRSNVFLTDGWMVPDHILWFPTNSQHIRAPQKRPSRSEVSKE